VVAHLPNIDAALAKRVADGLGLDKMPKALVPAREPRVDLKPSKALSILKNVPKTFEGRKVGVLVTDGVDLALLDALTKALSEEGATLEIVAPAVGGVKSSSGKWIDAHEKVGGGPSVLYDAVALLMSEKGAANLAKEPAARDFVADAFAHLKFIAYNAAAMPLLEKAGIAADLDEGCMVLAKPGDTVNFVAACRKFRLWERESLFKA
ncbi:MAG: catalase HPII, partial [Acidobacteriota bacterium]